MQESIAIGAGMLGLSAVLVMLVYMFGRLKLEQQKTLQMLLEKDADTRAEFARILGPQQRADSDFRRGLLMVVIGLASIGFLFMAGGIAWILGLVPVAVGCVYLFFWQRSRDRS